MDKCDRQHRNAPKSIKRLQDVFEVQIRHGLMQIFFILKKHFKSVVKNNNL